MNYKYKILRKVSEEEKKKLSLAAQVVLNILENHNGNIGEQELESLFSKEMARLRLN